MILALFLSTPFQETPASSFAQTQENGDGSVAITGNLRTWQTVTLSLSGPFAQEKKDPNPFLDFRFRITFTHESQDDESRLVIPGYFAADGNSAESSADAGNIWQAKFTPDRPGKWNYSISFVTGPQVAVDENATVKTLAEFDGIHGSFTVAPADSEPTGFRSEGRLRYVGKHLLEHSDSQRAFFKIGPDSPETLLAYVDFDQNETQSPPKAPLKTWSAHVKDWQDGDPTWQHQKGRGLVGAINYLSDQGLNSVSFLTYNVGGDGNNVWPHASQSDKLNFDCSKLDQWRIVFEHAQNRNVMLHFKLQETENDDQRNGHQAKSAKVPAALDGGRLGVERKLYLRELVARFAHLPAIEWNLGEENTQSFDEQVAMANYIRKLDVYDNLIVLHTYPDQQEKKYSAHLGENSVLTGLSLQNDWRQTHQKTLYWIRESAKNQFPWVVCNDEQGKASHGVPPDKGFQNFSGDAPFGKNQTYDANDIRKRTLWGNLMAGGGGVMYYFGYKLPENDLKCEDFRSREKSWGYCRIVNTFLQQQKIPLNEMINSNSIVGNPGNEFGPLCLAKENEVYLVYAPKGEKVTLDLRNVDREFSGV